MSLVEFLDARIAEDEVGWTAVRAREDDAGLPVTLFYGKPLADRMLTECAVKRQIVNAISYHLEMSGDVTPASDDLALTVLRSLASVYIGHPDYQEEWKVVDG